MKKIHLQAVAAIIILVLAAGVFLFRGRAEEPVVIDETRFMMGTMVRIRTPVEKGKSQKRIRQAVGAAFAEIERVEKAFSVYIEDSEISRINRIHPGEKLVISTEAYGLIKDSIKYSEMTAGAFDITVKPLADLWGECEKAGRVPTGDELKSVMSRVGFRYIELGRNPATISFGRAGMSIDMGAIAKGYATDRAIAILKAGGILNAIVNSGGDMYCLGQRSADRPWKIGIQHPRDKDKLIIEFFLKDKAVDTSGDYENFFIIDGKRYSHIIDPRKGYPVGDDVVSASVIASDSETADALATALCILGKDGFSIIDSVAAAAGIIVVEEKAHLNIYNSEAFKNIYEKDK